VERWNKVEKIRGHQNILEMKWNISWGVSVKDARKEIFRSKFEVMNLS